MNDENISRLCNELDQVAGRIAGGNASVSDSSINPIFTNKWVADEYRTVVDMRARGKPSYRNEYRIIKTLLDARTDVLATHIDRLELFVSVCKVIKEIEKAIKEVFEQQRALQDVNNAMEKLMSES